MGKQVTVLSGLTAAANDLDSLVTALKNLCGAGGTIKGDSIEIHGDHIPKISVHLRQMGYRIRS